MRGDKAREGWTGVAVWLTALKSAHPARNVTLHCVYGLEVFFFFFWSVNDFSFLQVKRQNVIHMTCF